MPWKGAFLEAGFLQRILTDVTRSEEVRRVGPNPVTKCPKGTFGHRHAHREHDVKMKGEGGVMRP